MWQLTQFPNKRVSITKMDSDMTKSIILICMLFITYLKLTYYQNSQHLYNYCSWKEEEEEEEEEEVVEEEEEPP